MARTAFSRCIVFFVLAAGCVSDQGGRYDPWYKPIPLEFFNGGPDTLESVPFLVVTANEAEAVGRLTDQEWAEVTDEEAKKYLAAAIGGTGGKLYLLRAPCLKGDPGSFTVTWRKPQGDVQVLFRRKGRDTRRPAATEHRAVIARLPAPPKELFPNEWLFPEDE